MNEDMMQDLNKELELYKQAIEDAREALASAEAELEEAHEAESWFRENDPEDDADWIIIF